jgi:hypothetical protein
MNIFDENSQDHHLRQKLDNIEFELPTNAWADMQARLDEVAITQSDEALRQQVAAQNLPPPTYAWDDMRQQLDQIQQPNPEIQLREQVAQHQWTMPAFAWEQLDNQLETQSLQEKVAEHQHQLPANAWAKMEQQLDIDARRRKRKAVFWWSAAAASLLLLTTATVYNYQPTANPVNTNTTQIASNQNGNNQNTNNNLSPLIINSVTKSLQLFNNSTYSNQGHVANPQIISPNAPIAAQNNNSKLPKANLANTSKVKANTNLANNAKANIDKANTTAETCLPTINVATISPQPLSNNQFIEEPIFLEKGRPSPWQANVWAGIATKIVQGSNKVALSPVIGIGATYQIDAHNKFVVGLQYKQISPQGSFAEGLATTLIDYNPAQEAARNNNHSMNLMADANDEPTADIYQLNKINMIEVPIAYHYQVNKKHAFQVGTKIGFIANINTTRQKPQQTPALKLNRYDVGIGVVNMAATLAYEYRFNRSFALNVQYTAGFSNLMSSAQKKYRAYGSFWGQDAAAGQVYMLLADNKPAPPVLIQTPEKMLNNDLQLSLRFNF